MNKNAWLLLLLFLPSCLWGIRVGRKISLGAGTGLFNDAMEFDCYTVGRSYSLELKYGLTQDLEIGFIYGYNSTYAAENFGGFIFPTRSVDEEGNVIREYPVYDRAATGRPYKPDMNHRAGFTFTKSESLDYHLKNNYLGPFLQFRSMSHSIFNPIIAVGVEYFSYDMVDNEGNQIEVLLDDTTTEGNWQEFHENHWGLFARLGAEFFPIEPLGIQAGIIVHLPFTSKFTKEVTDSLYGIVGGEAKITFYYGGVRDRDKDGVNDKLDKCPDTPYGAAVDEFGCPMDSDGDGVYDGLDECPNTPYGALVDLTGCSVDSDNDAVPDGIDRCPSTPSEVRVDSLGCPVDRDNDGVADYRDICPNTPIGAVVDSVGCPLDSDGDGVYDGIDKCPNTEPGKQVEETGCPVKKVDSDGDGVSDDIDKCPYTPRGAIVDNTGCPVDSDDDTVPDYKDNCPRTPLHAIVDSSGCPLDSDGDEVYDGIDNCPNTPADVEVDSVGCPLVKELKRGEAMTIRAHFESCQWKITPKVAEELEPALQLMKAYPEMRVVIEGHTDDRDPTGECGRRIKNNTELSIQRAKSVKEWLISQGIDPARMETIGYGESRPVDTNLTPEGRAKNRRIEIRRLD